MTEPITDDTSRALRTAWFDYLDAIEPLRPALHAYGLKLTGDVWDAEDLVQDTLLKGFAMIGRGDLHGPGSPVADTRAYMFRTASNLWIDRMRRTAREQAWIAEPRLQPAGADPDAARQGAEALFAVASPQARAAVVLKDVFDFTLEEIADQLRTTVGAVKAALHRGRAALAAAPSHPPRRDGPSQVLVERFIDAFNSRDVPTLTAVLTETCSIEVPGVGGGRGRRGGWAEASVGHAGGRLEAGVYRGEPVVLFFNEAGRLYDIVRLEGDGELVSRITNYCYCPDTLEAVAAELGHQVSPLGYHQPPDILTRMIATTTLPWGETGLRA